MYFKNKLKQAGKLLSATLLIGTALLSAQSVQAADITTQEAQQAIEKVDGAIYPIGNPNTAYEKYFTGDSFLFPMTSADDPVNVSNVTFAPKTINHWHIHHGSCQVLAGVSGKGYYQIWGQPVQEMLPGTSVVIPENVKHWHGAQHDSWFQHLSIMKSGATTEWLEPVNPDDYANLK